MHATNLRASLPTVGLLVACVAAAAPAFAQPSPSTTTVQAAATPMTADEMTALFKEKAALGREKDQLQEQAKPLLSRADALEQEKTRLNADRAAYKQWYDVAYATCNDKVWEGALAHCAQDNERVRTTNANLTKRAQDQEEAYARLEQEMNRLADRRQAVEERLKQIEARLGTQKAFASANKECSNKGPLEAQVHCMQVEWDRADPNITVIVPDPPQMRRTPEQAIEEYRRSGPPSPLIRPKGGGKEPPPPPAGR